MNKAKYFQQLAEETEHPYWKVYYTKRAKLHKKRQKQHRRDLNAVYEEEAKVGMEEKVSIDVKDNEPENDKVQDNEHDNETVEEHVEEEPKKVTKKKKKKTSKKKSVKKDSE